MSFEKFYEIFKEIRNSPAEVRDRQRRIVFFKYYAGIIIPVCYVAFMLDAGVVVYEAGLFIALIVGLFFASRS